MLRMFSAAFSLRASAAASFAPSRPLQPSKLPDALCKPLLNPDPCACHTLTVSTTQACYLHKRYGTAQGRFQRRD